MRAKDIYEIYFPFQEGQGGKNRPVLVFVLTSTSGKFIGLKITRIRRDVNRVEIEHWKEAGLDEKSYVQCDYYSVFENHGKLKYKGTLRQSDYDQVVRKFNEFYPVLEWAKQE